MLEKQGAHQVNSRYGFKIQVQKKKKKKEKKKKKKEKQKNKKKNKKMVNLYEKFIRSSIGWPKHDWVK